VQVANVFRMDCCRQLRAAVCMQCMQEAELGGKLGACSRNTCWLDVEQMVLYWLGACLVQSPNVALLKPPGVFPFLPHFSHVCFCFCLQDPHLAG
jgi:hypothetical protein